MILIFIVKLIMYQLIGYCICQVLVESDLFTNFRNKIRLRSLTLGKLVSCMLCSAIWISFLMSIFIWSPSMEVFAMDIVNMNELFNMNFKILLSDSNLFGTLVLKTMLTLKIWYYQFLFVFLDGMLGGTIIWFIHGLERRLYR